MLYTIENNKIVFNISKSKENYGQRNNEFVWVHPQNDKLKMSALSMCNVTSIVMALDYAGWSFPSGKYKQPEDNLCDFIFSDKRVLDHYKKILPSEYIKFEKGLDNALLPNLIHDVLEYATNMWLTDNEVQVDTFSTSVKISDIIQQVVVHNMPVVLSGNFPYIYKSGARGTLGHINTLVGVQYDLSKIKNIDLSCTDNLLKKLLKTTPELLIIDDPYGDYKQNFVSGTGNDVKIVWDDFISMYKPQRDVSIKWAHYIKKSPAIV